MAIDLQLDKQANCCAENLQGCLTPPTYCNPAVKGVMGNEAFGYGKNPPFQTDGYAKSSNRRFLKKPDKLFDSKLPHQGGLHSSILLLKYTTGQHLHETHQRLVRFLYTDKLT